VQLFSSSGFHFVTHARTRKRRLEVLRKKILFDHRRAFYVFVARSAVVVVSFFCKMLKKKTAARRRSAAPTMAECAKMKENTAARVFFVPLYNMQRVSE